MAVNNDGKKAITNYKVEKIMKIILPKLNCL
ncbi:MAG: hypothetical protein CM15mP93_00580 [Thiotrichaceae bacterium]|nr:MAG: hypothetical protein CM15mP93_00580 [Thiotrichaceae bacterium]